MRLLALCFIVSLGWLKPAIASPEEIRDQEQQYRLKPQPGFETATTPNTLRYYKGSGGALSLSRIEFPNRPAWWRDKSFFSEVERGVAQAAKSYALKSRKQKRVDGVPALDLKFERTTQQGRETVHMRFLFFRRYALVASAAVPRKAAGAVRSQAQAFIRSLRPLPKE